MDALPRNAIIATTAVSNVPAILTALFKCKNIDPSVFFVGWFCGFDDSDVYNQFAMGSLDADALSNIVHVQQLAHEHGLQRRRVLVVLNSDVFCEGYEEIFLHGNETHDIFTVLVQQHTSRTLNADVVAIDKTGCFPFVLKSWPNAVVAYDDQDVLVLECKEEDKKETADNVVEKGDQDVLVLECKEEDKKKTAANVVEKGDQDVLVLEETLFQVKEEDTKETSAVDETVREVIMPVSTKPKRTTRRPRQKKEAVVDA
jgi:hypothetical protein